jgi:AcrR family transcriptional regulator
MLKERARPGKQRTSTPERIVEAAIETLREEGFAGTTARAIAQRGNFNQALIFYHFGSVPALLLETFCKTSEEQIAKYRSAASAVGSLHDLVEIARRLHVEDTQTGSVTAVTQLMAAAASDDEVGRAILDLFESWIGIVEEALRRGLGAHPMGSLVPVREAAYAISAMFLGIGLMNRLDPQRSEADSVFDAMALLAQLAEQLTPGALGAD